MIMMSVFALQFKRLWKSRWKMDAQTHARWTVSTHTETLEDDNEEKTVEKHRRQILGDREDSCLENLLEKH